MCQRSLERVRHPLPKCCGCGVRSVGGRRQQSGPRETFDGCPCVLSGATFSRGWSPKVIAVGKIHQSLQMVLSWPNISPNGESIGIFLTNLKQEYLINSNKALNEDEQHTQSVQHQLASTQSTPPCFFSPKSFINT